MLKKINIIIVFFGKKTNHHKFFNKIDHFQKLMTFFFIFSFFKSLKRDEFEKND